MEQTWEMVVEPKHPIAVSELELTVTQGRNLEIPFERAALIDEINDYWNSFIQDMALRQREKIRDALARGDNAAYTQAIQHIAGITSMYRLNYASLDGSQLALNIGVTDFKEYIGTTQRALSDSVFRSRIITAGLEDCADSNYYFANPLATCAVLVTADGYVPVGLRGNTVAIYPNTYHVVGGYVKINEEKKANFSVADVDPFANMKKELEGEMGLVDTTMASAAFLGIARNKITRGPEALYAIHLAFSKNDLMESWRATAKDKYEHRNLTFYATADLSTFLTKERGCIVPSGEAALTLFARHYS
ncbi:hypothetical protein HZC31_04570 [Candidatus Woesearchaeota archaeon]|nr:hypothetical protein [Candidatus Woesearchaeota archaeon]